MDGHILLVHLPDEVLVSQPSQPANAGVSPADIHQQLDQGLICLVGHGPVRRPAVVGHLNGDGPVVVGGV